MANKAPEIGKPAPDFVGLTGEDERIALKDLRGKNVVLYFYPKDNTSGCTREAEAFRDARETFAGENTVILGVSRDSLASHARFREKYGLNFPLIADTDETICKAYDVIREKTMYGRTTLGLVRSTFLIDTEGVLRREWRKVKVDGHADAVLAAVRELA